MPLPIAAFRETILAELERAGELILAAPTGAGKSTQLPQFIRTHAPGRVLVLEPRRLSARSLAARVASETGTSLGEEVGYQVRFDARFGPKTKILFQTYGLFVQRLLREPSLPGVDAVLFDEFHERSLDADLALAWLKALRRRRPELKLVVMSATLDGGELERFLPGAARLDVPGRLFPVAVRHAPLGPREGLDQGALRALDSLAREGLDGSVLVFMPGLREIRRALETLGPFCRAQGLELRGLHGSMSLEEQQSALEPSSARRVIVATNVAETGLTVPQVTAVIDGGRHRVAGYDAARGVNTLELARISRANAVQRAGRAGRVAPGRCVRLWSLADEAGMAANLAPEISRLELSALFLQGACLPAPVEWPAPPPPAAWASARTALLSLDAIDAEGRATARGRALARYAAPPRVAAVLEAARALGPDAYERACAMAAAFESVGDRRTEAPADLNDRAEELLRGGRGENSRETLEIFRQFQRLENGQGHEAPPIAVSADDLPRIWLEAFSDRLAAREGEGGFYRLGDGRGATLTGVSDPPPLLLALSARERTDPGGARRAAVELYLAYSVEQVARMFPGQCAWASAAGFDARKERVVREERLMFRGLAIARREVHFDAGDRRAAADIWADKFARGELRHPGLDEAVAQFVTRVRLAREFYPDLGYPELNEDDWRLIYGEAFHGRNTLKDVERAALLPQVESYLGVALKAHLDHVLPARRALPSGRTGRFLYFSPARAELSARLGDFAGMSGTLNLCEGRLPVAFDILAPNRRTVQKTGDLGSFWRNAYPAIKKELQRRYPKHPWP